MGFQTGHKFFSNHANAPLGVVDAPGVAIGEHHPRIDHRCAVRWHHRPAEALHVNQAQQVLITDVFPGDITDVERQPTGQAKASQGRLEKDFCQIGGILE